jgi:aminoglycoside/choline kinase family phosphotransferase
MSQETPTDSVWLERARRSSARHLGAGALALLPPHASTRRYARWTPDAAGAVSRVGMLLPLAQDAPDEVGGALVERIEEEPFVVVQQWLAQAGVRVPHVLALDRDDHVIWLEDVGSLDFDQWLQRDRPPRVEAYQAALSTLKRWQQLDRTTAPRIVTERRFDERLIAWELDHYRT